MNEMSTVYNNADEVVATFYNGVAWCKKTGNRLGECYDNSLFDSSLTKVATLKDNSIVSTTGQELGSIEGSMLLVNGSVVGRVDGDKTAGAAAIAFIFNQSFKRYH